MRGLFKCLELSEALVSLKSSQCVENKKALGHFLEMLERGESRYPFGEEDPFHKVFAFS